MTFTAAATGQVLTATATDSAGNTSEFSAALNVPVAVAANRVVSGTIYEDVNGDGSIAGDSGAAGVTVRLYEDDGGTNDLPDATDTLVRTAGDGRLRGVHLRGPEQQP